MAAAGDDIVGLTPSRTGIQISLGGYAGVALGWVEGIEIDFMGLVAGIDVRRPAIKIPAWGRIGLEPRCGELGERLRQSYFGVVEQGTPRP